jgi:hypothetical protein
VDDFNCFIIPIRPYNIDASCHEFNHIVFHYSFHYNANIINV